MAQHDYTNELIHESSPYLQQHAHNPVDWYPWGDKALDKAAEYNKLLVISIGYSACHWCHVMEEESFEDTSIAHTMNQHYVSIKVDREERPDIDQVYMKAAQLLTGRGGWPLNVIALPDGRPVFAGTYFPNDQWSDILDFFHNNYADKPDSLIAYAAALTEGITSVGKFNPVSVSSQEFELNIINSAYQSVLPQFDTLFGGRKGAPKFPSPVFWEFVLELEKTNGSSENPVYTLLDNLGKGGINDQLAGGFARYSTDDKWRVPHFEKMLYDNAQLISLYVHAWQQTKNDQYKRIAEETLAFVNDEMRHQNGGYYSSIDADSQGEEGTFYTWSYEELETILNEDAPAIMEYFNCSKKGNWENGKNILYRTRSISQMLPFYDYDSLQFIAALNSARLDLLKARKQRVLPAIDDKILTSWNALMLKANLEAYRAFQNEEYLDYALHNARFLSKYMIEKRGGIQRSFKDGKASITGFLDDYAFTIDAFIELYQSTFDEKWLKKAKSIADHALCDFYDETSGMFYYSPTASLISREYDIHDGVMPSSNSAMCKNLIALYHYYGNEQYIEVARNMLTQMEDAMYEDLYAYGNWASAALMLVDEPYEVAIVGNDAVGKAREIDQDYLPHILLYGTTKKGRLELLDGKFIKGQTTIYVCRNKTCNQPVTSAKDALIQLK